MPVPTPVIELRAAAVVSILAVVAILLKFRRGDDILPDGTDSSNASRPSHEADDYDLKAYFDNIGELERLDLMAYDFPRLEMLNAVLSFIEGHSVDHPAHCAKGLEDSAITDAVMTVTDQHARVSDGTLTTLGRIAADLVVRSERLIKLERIPDICPRGSGHNARRVTTMLRLLDRPRLFEGAGIPQLSPFFVTVMFYHLYVCREGCFLFLLRWQFRRFSCRRNCSAIDVLLVDLRHLPKSSLRPLLASPENPLLSPSRPIDSTELAVTVRSDRITKFEMPDEIEELNRVRPIHHILGPRS
ncbi:hypothetical protein FA95DRAFT_558104 [Auriscalpium vulgare]|uniref:Uncharacterized protein n=1 Tax=Auriscalpium vulgare TaxID=40419 RepID=A0ACB8REZ0_9AGAM|nr:hypothetical protein FA95DRAFT_558104 [Auriscalpium vulgare]